MPGCVVDCSVDAAAWALRWHTFEPMLVTLSVAAPFILIITLMLLRFVIKPAHRAVERRQRELYVIKGLGERL